MRTSQFSQTLCSGLQRHSLLQTWRNQLLSELHNSERKDLHIININGNGTSEIILSNVVEWTWYRLFNLAVE